jgi:hypothetical protein
MAEAIRDHLVPEEMRVDMSLRQAGQVVRVGARLRGPGRAEQARALVVAGAKHTVAAQVQVVAVPAAVPSKLPWHLEGTS